jgi:hypothetical protein
MMLDQVKNLSYQMRLFGIHQACERRASEAFSQQLHPLEFLRLLLEEELLSRKDRTAKALVTKARFRGLGEIFVEAQVQVFQLGKTHLAIALGKRLCQEGHPTQFLAVNFLFEEIQAARAAGRYLHYIRSLIKAKVLILDDLGLRNYTHEEATSLMDILEERYHKAPLIVTSQVEPQGWLKLFEDPVIGEAIVDRLIHPAQKITLKGEKSYREKLAEKKSSLKNQGGLM